MYTRSHLESKGVRHSIVLESIARSVFPRAVGMEILVADMKGRLEKEELEEDDVDAQEYEYGYVANFMEREADARAAYRNAKGSVEPRGSMRVEFQRFENENRIVDALEAQWTRWVENESLDATSGCQAPAKKGATSGSKALAKTQAKQKGKQDKPKVGKKRAE